MNHPKLGNLRYMSGENCWIGNLLERCEIYLDGDYEELDSDCETLAVNELKNPGELIAKIDFFLDTTSEPYLDRWAQRQWELARFIFTKKDEKAAFIAEYYLERDDYTVWQVYIEQGNPLKLGRR